MEKFLPHSHQKEPTLPIVWPQTSSLWDNKFLLLSHSVVLLSCSSTRKLIQHCCILLSSTGYTVLVELFLASGDGWKGLWNPRAEPYWLTNRAGWSLCTGPHGLTGHRGNGDCTWEGGLGNVGGREETTWGGPLSHPTSIFCQKYAWLNVTQSCKELLPDLGATRTEPTLPHPFSVGSALTHHREGRRELGGVLHHSLASLLKLLHQSSQNWWVLLTWALYLIPQIISEGLG